MTANLLRRSCIDPTLSVGARFHWRAGEVSGPAALNERHAQFSPTENDGPRSIAWQIAIYRACCFPIVRQAQRRRAFVFERHWVGTRDQRAGETPFVQA